MPQRVGAVVGDVTGSTDGFAHEGGGCAARRGRGGSLGGTAAQRHPERRGSFIRKGRELERSGGVGSVRGPDQEFCSQGRVQEAGQGGRACVREADRLLAWSGRTAWVHSI